ncbi:MAG: choice-of-anchor J domain-containing protein [Bacteroidetes bacterium]|nr:choice-of-anchor J domain-containing protein [Bacteroidota bacterium]
MKRVILILIFISLYTPHQAQVNLYTEEFTNCITSLPNGWMQYSVIGTDSWQCTSSGFSGHAAYVNGYNGSNYNTNNDWLISPTFNISTSVFPVLSFKSRTAYNGNLIEVLVSNNYTGSGNPNAAIWQVLPASLPSIGSNVWTNSGAINLQAYKNLPIHIAFRYTSNTSAASSWRIDNIMIDDDNVNINKRFINIGQTESGTTSEIRSFQFTVNSMSSDFIVEVPTPFEISLDSINFNQQIQYTPSITGLQQTVYVRIHPVEADKVYRKPITFLLDGNILPQQISLLGTSLPNDKSLRIVTWNMHWFGDASSCNCDVGLAKTNAHTLMQNLDADIYCLQEVVDTTQLVSLCNLLGGNYAYAVSGFSSFALDTGDPSYASGQKLAYIYNKNKIENVGNFGLLLSTYVSDISSPTSYYCFSSGRYPLMMQAKLKSNTGQSDTLLIANIHAKANSDITSYERRQCAAERMTDSLNTLYPGKKVLVIGDFNDLLEGSSVSGMSVSPYQYMFNNGFEGITLPSKFPGQTTYPSSTNYLVDNVVGNSNVMNAYADSSCFIVTEVMDFIDDYITTSSDHLPVMSYFKFNFPNSIHEEAIRATDFSFTIQNPSSNTLQINLNNLHNKKLVLYVFDITGKTLYSEKLSSTSTSFYKSLAIQQGCYLVSIGDSTQQLIKKWLVIE